MTYSFPTSTDTEIVAELELTRGFGAPYALIVEGSSDANLLSLVVNNDLRIIHSSSGRRGVLDIIDKAPHGTAVGLIDRDFCGAEHLLRTSNLDTSRLNEPSSRLNIVMTDRHDLHMEAAFVLRDSWLRTVARKLWEKSAIKNRFDQKIRNLIEDLDSLLSVALELAYKVAALRIISISRDENWAFGTVTAAQWINATDQFEGYKTAITQRSKKSEEDFMNSFGQFYDSVLINLRSQKEYLIGDHDLIDIFNQLIYHRYGESPSKEGLISSLQIAVDHGSAKVASLDFIVRLNNYFPSFIKIV